MSFLKGVGTLTFANILFLGSGYAVQVLLGNFLTPADYGVFGVLVYIINLMNALFASGFLESVSRSVAKKPQAASDILKKAARAELMLSLGLALIYLLLSPFIARVLNYPEGSGIIALSSILIPIYGVKTVYVGFLNGKKRFTEQSISIGVAGILKIALVGVFIFLGYGILHILIAYALSAAATLILGIFYTRREEKTHETISSREILKSGIILSLYASVFPLMSNMDLLFVKALIQNPESAGFYNTATTLASFPQYFFGSIRAVILPLIAIHTLKNGKEKIQEAAGKLLHYGTMILGIMTVLSIATAKNLIIWLYKPEYLPAEKPFILLIVGLSIIALAQAMIVLLISIGEEKKALTVALMSLACDGILQTILIPRYGIIGAAFATTSTGILIFILAVALLKKHIGQIANRATYKKIISVIGILIIAYFLAEKIAAMLLLKNIGLIVFYGIGSLLMIAIFFFTKNITREDIEKSLKKENRTDEIVSEK